MQINENGSGGFYVYAPDYDIERTFTCGQCFRFGKHPDIADTYCGIAFGRYLEVMQNDYEITFNCDEGTYKNLWHTFFDLDNNYSLYIASSRFMSKIESRFISPFTILLAAS